MRHLATSNTSKYRTPKYHSEHVLTDLHEGKVRQRVARANDRIEHHQRKDQTRDSQRPHYRYRYKTTRQSVVTLELFSSLKRWPTTSRSDKGQHHFYQTDRMAKMFHIHIFAMIFIWYIFVVLDGLSSRWLVLPLITEESRTTASYIGRSCLWEVDVAWWYGKDWWIDMKRRTGNAKEIDYWWMSCPMDVFILSVERKGKVRNTLCSLVGHNIDWWPGLHDFLLCVFTDGL